MLLNIAPYPRRSARPLLLGIALLVVTVMAAEGSRLLTLEGQTLSPIWPISGLFLGAILARGWRTLPWLMLGYALWLLGLQHFSWQATAWVVVGMAIGSGCAALLLRTSFARFENATPLQRLSVFYLCAAVIGASINASFGTLGYMANATNTIAAYSHTDIALVYWAFEAFGIMLFTPLAYLLLQQGTLSVQELKSDSQRSAMMTWAGCTGSLLVGIALSDWLSNVAYAGLTAMVLLPLMFWFFLQANRSSTALMIPLIMAAYVLAARFGWGGLTPIQDIQGLLDTLLIAAAMTLVVQLLNAMAQERNRLIQTFRDQANTDFLTGLHNSRFLNATLTDVLTAAPATASPPYWLTLFEVVDIEPLTDLYSLQQIQTLEQHVASQLAYCTPTNAVLARLSSGRFAILCRQHERDTNTLCEQLYAQFNQCIVDIDGEPIRLRIALASVALTQNVATTATSPSYYLNAATHALFDAKYRVERWLLVSDTVTLLHTHQQQAQQLEVLKTALYGNGLRLFVQPITALQHDLPGHYYEVLLRLQTPTGDLLSPVAFLPIAEQYGLMVEVDRWVIEHTFRTLHEQPTWQARTHCCAINLSGASLTHEETATYIREQQQRFAIPAHIIQFEITETERIGDVQIAIALIDSLKQDGFSVALDDFGAGLSSFAYLKRFNVDCIKIDGQFIRQLTSNALDQAIVKSMRDVARTEALCTVAEFVEDHSTQALLTELGIHYAQGYGIAKPMPMADLFLIEG